MRALSVVAVAALLLPTAALADDPCVAPLPHKGTHFAGEVTWIIDGDGMCVGHEQGGIEVRLADFYAPELHSPDGPAAKKALGEIALGKRAECIAGKRSWDRTVARCTINGVPVGDAMRAKGIKEGGRGR